MGYWITAAVDAAYGQSLRADYTAIVIGARDLDSPTPKVHLLDMYQVRAPMEAVPGEIERMYDLWRPDSVGVENTLWQAAIVRSMRQSGTVPFHEIDRRKSRNPDKKTRAGNLAFHYSEGHIWHPRPAPSWMRLWDGTRLLKGADALEYFEGQLLAFTGDEGRDDHDDLVDAWTDVVDRLTLIRNQETAVRYHGMTWDKTLPNRDGAVLLNDRVTQRLSDLARAREEALV